MDRLVEQAKLDDLDPMRRDKTTVRRPAAGGCPRRPPGLFFDNFANDLNEFAAPGVERRSAVLPFQLVIQTVAIEDLLTKCNQALPVCFRRVTKVEQQLQSTGDYVAGAAAGVNGNNLQTGRREVLVAVVPYQAKQFAQHRGDVVDRVARQFRIGHMTLFANDSQFPGQRSSPAGANIVRQFFLARRLPDQAIIDGDASVHQCFHDLRCTVYCWAFFVAGQQERDRSPVGRIFRNERFGGSHHRRQCAFHIGAATTK